MRVTRLNTGPFRSIESLSLDLPAGITSLVGPNGAGKTNTLESVYFALTGRSFRTADRRELIPHGGDLARSEVEVTGDDGARHRLLGAVTRADGRRHLLDGSPSDPAEIARHRPRVAVFAPDLLALVKGPPAERRAHLDGLIAARWTSRSDLRRRFGQALAQRNALIARVAAGRSSTSDIDPWDATLASAMAPLVEARGELAAELAAPFAAAAAELGLQGEAEIAYAPRAAGDAEEIRAGLAERRDADLRLGRTSWGAHLDEFKLSLDGKALRRFGSQGQQRLGLLALLSAERALLLESTGTVPLLLLDDVMSELDPGRRDRLVDHLGEAGQTLVTAADRDALPTAARRSLVSLPLGTAGAGMRAA
jgi:DNA replication and repair protein RecF